MSVASLPAVPSVKTPLLVVDSLCMRFGGLLAMDSVSLKVMPQHITAVIGPNGAGKTTFFNCLTGFYKPTSGSITLDKGHRQLAVHKLAGHHITRGGIARTFQNIRLFGGMTVLENLMVAQHQMLAKPSALWGGGTHQRREKEAVERARTLLELVRLTDKADWLAENLPYGEQRKLEIARALCLQPKLLCLDEPAAGLNPKESQELAALLRRIRSEHNTAILLIEHDMGVVMGLADHVVVLEYGRKIADGTPAEVQANPDVIRAYLGEDDEAA